MESEKAPVDLGPWRVCLIICRDMLVVNAIATNSTNFCTITLLNLKARRLCHWQWLQSRRRK